MIGRPDRTGRRSAALVALLAAAASMPAGAAETLVAVATNFVEVVEALRPPFERATAHRLRIIAGSTGKLYAQIVNGAPFEVFLAADQARPVLLLDAGRAASDSRFTYAYGRLALWSADPARLDGRGAEALRDGALRHVAIANPELAPYGAAAMEALQALELWPQLQRRVVLGQNVGDTFAMVATGNAELGFVALASVLSPRNTGPKRRWDVPTSLHSPIRQDAVLLRRGQGRAAAEAFLRFLRSPVAQAIIARYGYGVVPPAPGTGAPDHSAR